MTHPCLRVEVVDYHTAGEPFRIVTGGARPLEGATVLDRRSFAAAHVDDVRRLVVNEPRGHADMYGGFVTPPDDADADIGVVFFHKDGYSTACGHGTIALVTWAIESGRIAGTGAETPVVVDVPSGRLTTVAEIAGAKVVAVSFVNVPSYVSRRAMEVPTASGNVTAAVAYGGAYYASVDVDSLGWKVEPRYLDRLIPLGREIKAVLNEDDSVRHPLDPRLSGLYGTIFYETTDPGPPLHQRNVTVFADGEVDRSPCGSGTSARLAILDASGELPRGDELIHDSIVGSRFTAAVVGDAEVAGNPGVSTRIRGSAFRTGAAVFELDPSDPIGLGFQLR